jgi:hypothetical protein
MTVGYIESAPGADARRQTTKGLLRSLGGATTRARCPWSSKALAVQGLK